jgi:hypothetical protein
MANWSLDVQKKWTSSIPLQLPPMLLRSCLLRQCSIITGILLHHCSLTHSFNLYVSSVSLSSTSDFFDSSSAQLNGVEVMMKTAFKILEKNSGPEEAGLLMVDKLWITIQVLSSGWCRMKQWLMQRHRRDDEVVLSLDVYKAM